MKNFRGSALAAGVGTPESVPHELQGSSLHFYLRFKHRNCFVFLFDIDFSEASRKTGPANQVLETQSIDNGIACSLPPSWRLNASAEKADGFLRKVFSFSLVAKAAIGSRSRILPERRSAVSSAMPDSLKQWLQCPLKAPAISQPLELPQSPECLPQLECVQTSEC